MPFARHRDFYVAMAGHLEPWGRTGNEWRIEQTQTEIDNLRAAFEWSRECGDIALALQFASSMQPLWAASGRIQEGHGRIACSITSRPTTTRAPITLNPRRPSRRRLNNEAGINLGTASQY
jgi:predicted ATPase